MPIVTMPNGVQLDLGDNPSDEVKALAAKKFKELQGATSTPSTVGTGGTADKGATTTVNTEGAPPKQETPLADWGPTVARTAGPILLGAGAAAGVTAMGLPELAPAAYSFGAGVGGMGGDIEAQREELAAGQRTKYNPVRTLVEGVSNTLFSSIPMGNTVVKAVLGAGTAGVASNTGLALSEGQPIPSIGQNAIAFLTAGGLQAGHQYMEVRQSSIKEIAGTEDIASHVQTMTGPGAPTHGPDGMPTEVPPIKPILDPFGRPAAPEGSGYSTPTGKTQAEYQIRLDSFTENRRPGIFDTPPVKNTPPIDHAPVKLIEDDGGFADLKDSVIKQDLPGEPGYDDPSGMTTSFFKYVGRTKDYFARLEKETKYPVYQDYDLLSQANRKWQVSKDQLGKPAVDALKGVSSDDQLAMMQSMMRTNPLDPSGLSPALAKRVSALTSVTDRALRPFDISANEFWSEFVPAVAKGDTSGLDPDKYAKLIPLLESGRLNPRDPNLSRITSQLVSAGTFEETATPVIEALKKKYGPEFQTIPAAVREAVNYTANTMTGVPDRVSQNLGIAMQSFFDKHGWNFNGKDFANTAVALPYAALMGYRPAPLIRNAMQTLQTAVGPMGPMWLAEGYRQIMTEEGQALAKQSGVFSNGIMEQLALLGEGNTGKIRDWTISKGLAPFGFVENYVNRGPVYLGTRAKVLSAVEKAGPDLDKFLRLSGVNRYSLQDANIVKQLWMNGSHQEAADRAAQMMVDNTQFMYSALEKPRGLTGSSGKYLGSFGTWPLSYARFLVGLNERGGGAGNYEVARDITRWAAGNAAVAATFYGLAKLTGGTDALMHTFGWTFVAPTVYSGGPVMEFLKSGADAASSIAEGEPFLGHQKGYMTRRMGDFLRAGTTMTPLGGLGMDVYKASQEKDFAGFAGRMAGINRGKVAPQTGFKPYSASKPYGQFK